MPWPMVHFAIAEKVRMSNANPQFLLGSIAPDAIHMRGKVTRTEKGYTHFVVDGKWPTADIIKQNCLAYLGESHSVEWKEFILGYFAHIYTDSRWIETIYADFERMDQGEPQTQRKRYNSEMSQIEFALLRSEAWVQGALVKLKQANAFRIDPLLTQDEVSRYRDSKIEWLSRKENEPNIQPNHFTVERVKAFIATTSDELLNLFLYRDQPRF